MWSPSADGAERAVVPLTEPSIEDRNTQALGKWIDALSVAESGNRGWIIHQDQDGRDYYGCLQFREKTFMHFATKFRLVQPNEPAKVMNAIFDCALQKRVATRMIRENPENWKHWRKSTARIGLPPGAKAAVAEGELSRSSAPEIRERRKLVTP
jgi:hypothetical protein